MLHSSLLGQIDEVARRGSIRAASEVLNVSASSINRRLLQLEEDLGVRLFHRHSAGMRLTAAGEVVLAHIRQTLHDHDRTKRRLKDLRGNEGAVVRISAMHGLAAGILPRILKDLRRAHPGIAITVRAQTTAGVEDDLTNGGADLGLSYSWRRGQGIEATARFPTRLGVVVAADHPLASRENMRLTELVEWPLALPDETVTINHILNDAFERAGLTLQPTVISNSMELLKSMVQFGEAVTCLSRIDVDEDLRTGKLAYVPILGRDLKSHELRLGRRPDSTLNTFVTLTEEHLRRSIAMIERAAI